MRMTFFGMVLLLFAAPVLPHAQTAPKPEDGLISPTKYTNAFFGFSLPLPQGVGLRSLANQDMQRDPFRHFLYGANSSAKGYPVFTVLADEVSGSGNADPAKAVLALGAHSVDPVQITGQEFSRGRWKADNIYRVAYATNLKGYVLYICVFTFDKKILDEFESNIRQMQFFDPAKAREQAGPDSYPYEGPQLPSTAAAGNQGLKPNSETPSPQPGTETKTGDVTGAKPGWFYDKNLDLHFDYPVEMRTIDGASDMEIGHRNIFGMPGDSDPEHQEAKRCMKILLDADLPKENAPQRNADIGDLWVDDSKAYKESRKAEPIFAKILLVELVQGCVPPKLRKKEDDVLRNMTLSAVSIPGIGRMPKPIWYEVGKQKIHMNSGVGRPIVNGQLASAPIIIMSMATQWHEHLLGWVFTSNDAEIFNGITKSLVQFGNAPWGPMFAAPTLGPRV